MKVKAEVTALCMPYQIEAPIRGQRSGQSTVEMSKHFHYMPLHLSVTVTYSHICMVLHVHYMSICVCFCTYFVRIDT